MADLVLALGVLVGGGLIYYLDEEKNVKKSEDVKSKTVKKKWVDKNLDQTVALVTEPSPGVERLVVIQPEPPEQTDRTIGKKIPSVPVQVVPASGPPIAPPIPKWFNITPEERERFVEPMRRPEKEINIGHHSENKESREALLSDIRKGTPLRSHARMGSKTDPEAALEHSQKPTMFQALQEQLAKRRTYVQPKDEEEEEEEDEWETD